MIFKIWRTLCKFGLRYCDLPTVLWNISFLMRTLTVNIDSKYDKRISIYWYVWTIWLLSCYVYVWVFSMIWFVFWRCPETGDLIGAVCVFALVVTSGMTFFKWLYMFLYNETIKKIVDDYLICDTMVIPNSRFSKKLMETMKQVKKRGLIFWIMLVANGIFFTVKSLFSPGKHFMDDLFTIYGLEPINESPNYEIGYMLIGGSAFFICYAAANVSGFFIVIAGYTEGQMLALSDEIVQIWVDSEKQYEQHVDTLKVAEPKFEENSITRNKTINEYVSQKLQRIIVIHSTNVQLLYTFEGVFRQAILIEFVLLTVGLTAELLGGLENTYIAMPFCMTQVTMDCITGQHVMDASIVFMNAVYDCKWENFNVKNMKTILLILQNSQKTMMLSAGGIATLNFNCLMSVIRMVYSVYTALLTTMKRV